MTITEFAILIFHLPPNFSDPTLQTLFGKLSDWQLECSGFPLRFFTNSDRPFEVYLVTGWTNVEAHEAWIRGARNQELLRIFAPYVDIPRVKMVHLCVDFEAIPRDAGCAVPVVVERYDGAAWGESTRAPFERSEGYAWELVGRDLAADDGDVFRFVGVAARGKEVGSVHEGVPVAPVERWVLKRIEP